MESRHVCEAECGVKKETLLEALQQYRTALQSLNTTHHAHHYDKMLALLKSEFQCPLFLENLQSAQASNSWTTTEEGNSWDIVSENDLWKDEDIESDGECFILVRHEDVAEEMASLMVSYILSLDHRKDLTPNQLQKVLSNTVSVKNKGRLQKAWDGSKVIYNLASWGATAIGICQNPVIVNAATKAFSASCRVISKLR